MKIAVYCASSTAVSSENLTLGFELGAAIAKQGHELVWAAVQFRLWVKLQKELEHMADGPSV